MGNNTQTAVTGSDFVRLNRKARSCMALTAAIWTVIVLAMEIGVIVILKLSGVPLWLWILLGAVMALMLLYCIASPFVRYERYRYAIDDEAIRVREGFLWISYSIVPIERIHKIELSQGPVARIFGLFTVTVVTAGGEIDIRFIEEDVANRIAESLKDRINIMAAESRTEARS